MTSTRRGMSFRSKYNTMPILLVLLLLTTTTISTKLISIQGVSAFSIPSVPSTFRTVDTYSNPTIPSLKSLHHNRQRRTGNTKTSIYSSSTSTNPIGKNILSNILNNNNNKSTTSTKNKSQTSNNESNQLVQILLQSQLKSKPLTSQEKIKVDTLMQSLINQKVTFDPQICLNGPLYCALYQTGPTPFWERYDIRLPSFLSSSSTSTEEDDDERIDSQDTNNKMNLKGQRYTMNQDGSLDVLNYAEFFGRSLIATGVGVCRKNKQGATVDDDNDVSTQQQQQDKQKGGNAFTNFLTNFIDNSSSPSSSSNNSNLLTCPADYTIKVTGASIDIPSFPSMMSRVDLNIAGTGYLRILYADENVRIFTTPKDTESTNELLIDEVAGLTVVQVKVDLVDPTFSL